ncbi:MAG: AMP-binding protein [Acidimicrobiales bacterium]|jgi:fatty-acyl-CoA synthase
MTAAELLLQHRERDAIGLHFEDGTVTYREWIDQSLRRAALWQSIRDNDQPPHIGVLLDNTPDFLYWLGAAAISGAVIVGINATYRGDELLRLIDHSDCQAMVTSNVYGGLLEEAGFAMDRRRVLRTDSDEYRSLVASADGSDAVVASPQDDDLFLLIFTSGSTSFPKAVRCTQGRFARTGGHVATVAALSDGDGVYSPLPFFHSSSLFTGLASALSSGVPIGTRSKFSASKTMGDIRRMGATLLTYTGKVLNYILAVPKQNDDDQNPLRLALGNEASFSDIRSFAHRFGCQVRDSYGSTEGVIIIRRDAAMPEGALGTADDHITVLDSDTGKECPRVERAPDGTILNATKATGEIVNLNPGQGFEGYYRNEEATNERFREGQYWSGDLAYRDADGWFYFAGRSNEWLRVDGENFAAGVVESIMGRYGSARTAVIYAVPDAPVGDLVMAALEVDGPDSFDIETFDQFLAAQPDLGPKWVPAFVRLSKELPKLASLKVDKTRLRKEAWLIDPVYWRPTRGEPLRRLTDPDRSGLADRLG